MEEWWKHKLFQPRTMEGDPAKEQLDYIRELFKLASKEDPRLKGITIMGSTLKGYSRLKGENISDIDIATICDESSKISPNGSIVNDFLGKFYDAAEKLKDGRIKKKIINF